MNEEAYTLVDINGDVLIDIPATPPTLEQKIKMAESAVQAHINSVVVSRGYDNENSIAKYLVVGNPFYTECSAISLWIGAVWVYVFQVQADIQAGTRTEPTIEQLIAELPVLV